jgi:TolB-like protein
VPFEGDTPLTVGVKQKAETPKEPKNYNERIPEDLNRLILKCLEKDKENRYQSAEGLRSDLEKLEQGLPTTDRTGPKTRPPTSREITVQFSLKRFFLSFLLVLLVLAAGLLLWSPWKRKTFPSDQLSRTSIAVAYFNNRLANQDLDEYIIEMFSINLGRFDELKVLPQQLLADIFSQLRTDPSQTIDESTAMQVARRAGAEYIVTGSIFQVGEKISITTQLIDVREGENIAHEEVEGQSPDKIGIMVDVLTDRLCQKLGTSQDESEPVKIADVTTE